MKPLPDLDDVQKMAQTGRRSVLMRARNEACEALRDSVTRIQATEIGDVGEAAQLAIDQARRLIELSNLWRITNNESLEPLLEASIRLVKDKRCAPSTSS